MEKEKGISNSIALLTIAIVIIVAAIGFLASRYFQSSAINQPQNQSSQNQANLSGPKELSDESIIDALNKALSFDGEAVNLKKDDKGVYSFGMSGAGQYYSINLITKGDLNGDGYQDAVATGLLCGGSCGTLSTVVINENGISAMAYSVSFDGFISSSAAQYGIKSLIINNGIITVIANTWEKDTPTKTFVYKLVGEKLIPIQVYTNNQYGFEFEYPVDFKISESASQGTAADLDINVGANLSTNIGLMVTTVRVYTNQDLVKNMPEGESSGAFNFKGNNILVQVFGGEKNVVDEIKANFKFIDQFLDWKTYTNSQYGFEIKYPANFKETTDTNPAEIFSLNLGYNNTQYIGDLLVRVYRNSNTTTVAQYFAKKKIKDLVAFASHCQTCAMSDVDAEFDDCMVNSSDKIEIGGKDAFICNHMPPRATYLSSMYISYNGHIYEFSGFNGNSVNQSEYNQILSTFKFIDQISDWKTYTNSEYGISFKYPKNWIEGVHLQSPPVYPTFGVYDGNSTDQGAGFSVQATKSPYANLDEYIAAKQLEINKNPNISSIWVVKKFDLLNIGTVAGTFYSSNKTGNPEEALSDSVVFIKNGVMYIFYDYRFWETVNPIIYQIANTITFSKPLLSK